MHVYLCYKKKKSPTIFKDIFCCYYFKIYPQVQTKKWISFEVKNVMFKMYFSRSMWALRQATRNVSVDRQGTMGFTEEVVYHYLCHSLFHCCHLTTKTHTHRVFCRLKNNNKNKSPVFLQRKCHFSHHKTHPEKEERASSVSYPTQASLYR